MSVDKKYTIVIATGIYPPQVGGPALYVSKLEKIYSSQGHTVRVITFTDIERSLPIGIRHTVYFFRVLKAMYRADFVLIIDTFSAVVPAVCASKIMRIPSIVRTGGDFIWESYTERTGKKVLLKDFYTQEINNFNFKERIIFNSLKLAFSWASHIIFSTEWQKNIFFKPYSLDKIPQISIVENAYIQRESNSSEDILANNSFEHKKVFYAVTRPLVWKNNDYAQKAVNIARQEYPEIDLLLGPLSSQEATQELKQCYGVIQVSLGDISPNMVLEALSYGKPCIVTRECGILNRIQDYVIVVDPLNTQEIVDALRLLCTPHGYAEASSRAQKYIHDQKRDWNNVAEDLLMCGIQHVEMYTHEVQSLHNEGYVGGHCLMISTDRNLFKETSRVALRHKNYAQNFESLTILVFSLGKQDPIVLSPVCKVISTQSKSRWLYIWDAFHCAKNIHIPTQISCQDPFETAIVGMLLALKFSIIKAIKEDTSHSICEVQVHTDYGSPNFRQHSFLNRIRFYYGCINLYGADRIRVVSDRIRTFLIQKLRISPNKIYIKPIDLPWDEIKVAQKKFLDYDHPKGVVHFISVARFESEKNISATLDIISYLKNKGLNIKLTLIGSGSLEHDIRVEIHSKGLVSNVTIVPWTDSIYDEYVKSHILISTSLYEGYGLALKEASEIGLYVITTDVGIAPQLAQNFPDKVKVVYGNDSKSFEKMCQYAEEICKNILQ